MRCGYKLIPKKASDDAQVDKTEEASSEKADKKEDPKPDNDVLYLSALNKIAMVC